ncbi:MAG: hypothetical protein JWN85_3681 [Gammaproteobacteria bacterium]|nr:hypothetical protein [Gammaproteobacteria bacterium]
MARELPRAPTSQPSSRQAANTVDPQKVPTNDNVIESNSLGLHELTAQERHARIAEVAHRNAEQRGFAPGSELEDWLAAEREVDANRSLNDVV